MVCILTRKKIKLKSEPEVRIELTTPYLPSTCSTTELPRRVVTGLIISENEAGITERIETIFFFYGLNIGFSD